MMKRILPITILFSALLLANDFSEGPYGSNYFDTAGPFTLVDLNMEFGDVKKTLFSLVTVIWGCGVCFRDYFKNCLGK